MVALNVSFGIGLKNTQRARHHPNELAGRHDLSVLSSQEVDDIDWQHAAFRREWEEGGNTRNPEDVSSLPMDTAAIGTAEVLEPPAWVIDAVSKNSGSSPSSRTSSGLLCCAVQAAEAVDEGDVIIISPEKKYNANSHLAYN